MNWMARRSKLFLVLGVVLLIAGSVLAAGTLTGLIKIRASIEGEPGFGFSTKTWNLFPPLNLNEGDEAIFYIEMHPDTSLTEWGFFLYITNSSGQSVKTISRGSAFGGAFRNIEIPFIAPYTDAYEVRAYASSAPPGSLQIHSGVSILGKGQSVMMLELGMILLILGVIALSVSIYQRSHQTRSVYNTQNTDRSAYHSSVSRLLGTKLH